MACAIIESDTSMKMAEKVLSRPRKFIEGDGLWLGELSGESSILYAYIPARYTVQTTASLQKGESSRSTGNSNEHYQ